MNETEMTNEDLSGKPEEKASCLVITSKSKHEVVLYQDDDLFIKKTFENEPQKAFELLFRKYYITLCNHAVRFVYSRQKAEDIVSDVFVVFWQNSLYLKVKENFRAYLFASIRNKCFTYLKWELGKEIFTDIDEMIELPVRSTPEEIMMASDLHIKIERTIKSLPERQQQVFIMSRFEDKRNAVIAKELNLSIKTVEMHITKALTTLRKVFSDRE